MSDKFKLKPLKNGKDIKKIDESLAKVDTAVKKLNKSIADYGADEGDNNQCEIDCIKDAIWQIGSVVSELQWTVRWMQEDVRYLADDFSEHREGHLPPIYGADKMEHALKALGVANDYEVRKPVIFASTNKGPVAEVDYQPVKK